MHSEETLRPLDSELKELRARVAELESQLVEARNRSHTEEVFGRIVGSVRDYAIFTLDPAGFVTTWNVGAERIKGYRAAEIVGRHFSAFYPPDEVKAGKCEMELEVARRDGRYEEEGWRVRKDGTRFFANVVITAVFDPSGEIVGFAKVTRDLSDRRRAEADRSARDAAERANRAKDEFLAMLGHELRNPLAPIATALQLMKLRGDAQLGREHQIMERQVAHMMRLIDDLLDVSRITRGVVDLQRSVLDIRDVVAQAIEVVSPLFEQRRHRLELVSPRRALHVDGDESRLTQVLTNLLTNAAKYTSPGGVVSVVVREEGWQAVVEVCDNGVGLTPELLPRVFDLFVQGEQDSDRHKGGLGLGLAIVRSLVTAHGGTVEAQSKGAGRGSRFIVRLPIAEATARPTPERSGAQVLGVTASPRRILVVDDNEDARELLAELLSEAGHEVRTACDGPAALSLVRDFVPQIAFLDIGLPVMSGYELADRLRTMFGDRTARLIAISGYGQREDRERSRAHGFAGHLVKPVDIAAVLSAIQ
jgi:PAS domain S-box-containing protein